MGKQCLIYSGGEYCPTEGSISADCIIACDKGLVYAETEGVKPDLILGDFDSYDGDTDLDAVGAVRFQKEKDDTDTMLAVKYALSRGCDEITVTCALGARLDHTIANIQAGTYVAEHGGRATLLGRNDKVTVFSGGRLVFPRREGWSLSVFSLSDEATGVSIRGTKYPAERAVLTKAFPIGVSNEWAADRAEIEVKTGVIMVIESRLNGGSESA